MGEQVANNNRDSNPYLDDALEQSGAIYEFSQRKITGGYIEAEYNSLSNTGFTEPEETEIGFECEGETEDSQVSAVKKVFRRNR